MRYVIIILPFLLASCHNEGLKDFHLDKLNGTWTEDHGNGKFTEQWIQTDEHLMKGNGFMILEGDTMFHEFIELRYQSGTAEYVVSAAGQNNEKPVIFKLTKHSETQWVFENPTHDFPKLIRYNLKNKDSLIACIEGTDKGYFQHQYFRMKRE
jgi:hypothetical protein